MKAKWIDILIRRDTGKTFVWVVRAKQDDAELGEIRWFGRWRGYAFFPRAETLYEATCLRDIAEFIEVQMRARRGAFAQDQIADKIGGAR